MSKNYGFPTSMLTSNRLGQKSTGDGLTFSLRPIPLFSSQTKVFKQLVKSDEWKAFNMKFVPNLDARLKEMLLDLDRIERYQKARDNEATPFCLSVRQKAKRDLINKICTTSAQLRKKRGDVLAYLEIVRDVDHNDKEFQKVMRQLIETMFLFLRKLNRKHISRQQHDDGLADRVQLEQAFQVVRHELSTHPSVLRYAYDALKEHLQADSPKLSSLIEKLNGVAAKAGKNKTDIYSVGGQSLSIQLCDAN